MAFCLQTNTTPLHLAAINGHENLALLLIRSGASLTLKNSAGHNALVIAIMNGKKDVVEAIIDSDHWQVSTSFFSSPYSENAARLILWQINIRLYQK